MLSQVKGRSNIEVFSDTLLALAEKDPDILVVTGDSRGSAKLVSFASKLPNQVVEVGIAEQNLVGVSAGLASTGKKVFAVSPGCFIIARAFEQIKNDLAYSNNPVKLVGISTGVSYGALGSTHHAIHDLAALLAINNIDIIVPRDNFETLEATKAIVNYPKPVYLRLGKKPIEEIYPSTSPFKIGKAIILIEGSDLTFLCTGEVTNFAIKASDCLKTQGISCSVISMHTLKPLDKEAVLKAGRESRALITVEEHNVYGGLGSLCASILMQAGICIPMKIVGIPDEETVTGNQYEILSHYGISPDGLVKTAIELFRKVKG